MHLLTLGLNHQTAPLPIREKVAFHTEGLRIALQDLVGQHAVNEAAILSTCNRTEIYCNAEEPERALVWLANFHNIKPDLISPYVYKLPQYEAVKHTFRVASGLDSMVLGEPQILGQMKQAVRVAQQAGTLGTLLHKLFQRSFSVAKEVRSTTEIGANVVSMAAAAVQLAQRIFDRISEQHILFIGAGEMIELCTNHFAAHRPKYMTFANRSLERAQRLAARFQGNAITLAELPEYLAAQDIVITSTASSLPIIGKGLMERAIKLRKHRPIFIVDLAVPRDVEAEVAELQDVFLYTGDDLGRAVHQGLNSRKSAVLQAEAIIETQVDSFMHWMESRKSVPTIRELRERTEQLRTEELERALRMLAKGEDPKQVLDSLSRGLINKFLHNPNSALSNASVTERLELEAALRRLHLTDE